MSLRIVSADERLAEARGVKAAVFGKSGSGKTSLLFTLSEKKTLFADLEAGDLAPGVVPLWLGSDGLAHARLGGGAAGLRARTRSSKSERDNNN